MAQSPVSDSLHPAGKLPPTLTPTGQFSGKPTLPISRSVTLLGSRKQARLQLISSSVSQNHALIVNADSGPYVRDLASREHTLVNGVEVNEGSLSDGDEIQIGRFTFRFNASPQSGLAESRSEISPAPSGGIQIDGEDVPRPFAGRSILIGRREGCDIHIPDKAVSTTHAVIFEMDGRRYVRDLASRTGTLVNGKTVHQIELKPNDEVSIAGVNMRYVTDDAAVAIPEIGFDDLGAAPDELMAPEAGVAGAAGAAAKADEAAIPLAGAEERPEAEDAVAKRDQEVEDEVGPIEIEADLDAVLGEAAKAPADRSPGQDEPREAPLPLESLEPEFEPPTPVQKRQEPPTREPVRHEPIRPELAELTPADLDASKGESADDVTHSDSQRAPASASLGELQAEDLDITDEAQDEPADDLMGLAPAAAQGGGKQKVKEVFSEIKPANDEPPVADEIVPEAEPVDASGQETRATAEAEAEAMAEEVLGLAPEASPAARAAEPRELPPGASQLELTPVEEIEAQPEPDDRDRKELEWEAEPDLKIRGEAEHAAPPPGAWPAPVELGSGELEDLSGREAPTDLVEHTPPLDRLAQTPLEAALDQEALRAGQARGEDLDIAPDESFDTIEARQEETGAGLHFGGPAEPENEAREFEIAERESATAKPVAEDDLNAVPQEGRETTPTAEVASDEPELAELSEPAANEIEPPVIELGAEAPAPLAGDDPDSLRASDEVPAASPDDSARADSAGVDRGPAPELTEAAPVAGSAAADALLDETTVGEAVTKEGGAKPKRGSKRGAAAKRRPTRRAPKKKAEPEAPVVETPVSQPLAPEPLAPEPLVGEPPVSAAEDDISVAEAGAGALGAAEVLANEQPAETVSDEIEVLAHTDATPASALPLEESIAPASEKAKAAADDSTLSDSSFGRAMEQLAADSGPIVEEPGKTGRVAEPVEHDESRTRQSNVDEDMALELLSDTSSGEAPAGAIAPTLDIEPASAPGAEAEPEKLFDLPQSGESSRPPAMQEVADLALAPSAELRPPASVDRLGAEPADLDISQEPPHIPEPPVEAPRRGGSRYAPGASQLDLEPVSESELRADSPSAGSQKADQLSLEAVSQAPAPTAPVTDEPSYNWGANQEHFLGGMPLKLGGGTAQSTPAPALRPKPRPAATPAAGAPAARAPLTDDTIGEIESGGRAAAERQPQGLPPRPAPRRGGTFAGGRPMPFAGSDPSAPQVTTGFDGLAMPPVREADVFAPMAGGLTAGFGQGVMDDVFSGTARRSMPTPQPQPGGAPNAAAPAGGAPATAARRATRTQPPGDALSGASSVSSPDIGSVPASGKTHRPIGSHQRPPTAPVAAPTEAPPRKKRRWFGLRMLLIALAVPCAAGAGAAAYYLMPNRAEVRGEMKFENFQKLPQRDRGALAEEQRRLLADPTVRDAAQRKLAAIDASLSAGFLAGGVKLARIGSESKMDMESGTLTLPLAGADRADRSRMFALLQAMYDANGERARQSDQLSGTLESLRRQREQSTRKLEELKREIDKLASVAQAGPSAAERDKAAAEVKRLQAEWNESDVAVAALTRELEQLQATAVAAAPATTPAPAEQARAVQPDEELDALQTELGEVHARIAALQEADKGGLNAAGDRLQSALAGLEKRMEAARTVGDSPAFASYLDRAAELVSQVREQTVEFVKRHGELTARLRETEANLDEKKAARRAEVASRDPELVTLLDQRDLKTRQYNAALGDENLRKDAAEIKTELNFLESMILARQTQVADDGFNADAIDQLQRIADATRKEIEADRSESAEALTRLHAELAGSRPEELSAAQAESATALESGLKELAAARQQFVVASGATTTPGSQELSDLQAKAKELSGRLATRKAEAAEAPRSAPDAQAGDVAAPDSVDPVAEHKARVDAKAAELAAAQKRHDSAKQAYLAAQQKLTMLTEQATRAREAGEARDRLAIQRDAEQQTLDLNTAQSESRKREAEMLAYPAIPVESNVTSNAQIDRRPVYSLAAFGGVAALFSLGILLSGGGRRAGEPGESGEPEQGEDIAASEAVVDRPGDPHSASRSPAARVAEV